MRDTSSRGSSRSAGGASRVRLLLERPVVYGTLFVLAILIVVQHLFAHAGFRPLPLSMGWQDILVGYPTAAVVAIWALMLWGKNPTPH